MVRGMVYVILVYDHAPKRGSPRRESVERSFARLLSALSDVDKEVYVASRTPTRPAIRGFEPACTSFVVEKPCKVYLARPTVPIPRIKPSEPAVVVVPWGASRDHVEFLRNTFGDAVTVNWDETGTLPLIKVTPEGVDGLPPGKPDIVYLYVQYGAEDIAASVVSMLLSPAPQLAVGLEHSDEESDDYERGHGNG